MAAVQARFDMGETSVARFTSTLNCDTICVAVLPCVAIVSLLKCLKFCSKLALREDLDKSHVKHLALLYSFSMEMSSYSTAVSTTTQVSCGPSVDGISILKTRLAVGESTVYTCASGFEFCSKTEKSPQIFCQSDGCLSNPPVKCHRKRWSSFIGRKNVSLQLTCSVKTDSGILIRAFLTRLQAQVRVTLGGPEGALEHTFIVQPHMSNILELEYKAFEGKYRNKKESLMFRTTSSSKFVLLFLHLGSYIKVKLGGQGITAFVIPKHMTINKLSITGQVTTKYVELIRNYRV